MGLKIFAHANETAVEIALELFNPYPVGMLESKSSDNFVFSSSRFETIFSITLFINRELSVLLSDEILTPLPSDVSNLTLTNVSIPIVAPFLLQWH